MGHIDGRLNFDTKIDTKGFSKGLHTLGNQMNALMGIAGKLASALAAAFSVKEIIESAAEVKAAESQFEQTFGSLQEQARAAIDTVADESDILATRLQGTATKIYAFAKTSGMDSASALDMMNEALQVTADSAAYYDRSLEDTAETLQSFLKGNYANDAALGLSATETTRNAAANKLYGKSFMELSEAQKQLTLLQMVKEANELSGAMGQAAREADGWENVTGNLKDAWKQLLAAIGQPVLALAVPIVKNITSALQVLTSAAQDAAKALASVFDIDIDLGDTATSMADSSAEAADSYADMAESAEAVQEANENSLASFDQINKLGDDSSALATSDTDTSAVSEISTIGDAAGSEMTKTEQRLSALFKRIKTGVEDLLEPIKNSWAKNSAELIGSAEYAFGEIIGLLGDIGASIATVWTNGTGEKTLDHILRIITNINTMAGNLAASFRRAWKENDIGTSIVQHAADIINTILGHVEKISKKWSDWAGTVNFSPLLTSLDGLEQSLLPFTDSVGEGLEWFTNNVLIPLADWTIGDAIPAFLDLLSSCITAIQSVWETAAPVLEDRLWKGFLEPIASWAGETSVKLIRKLAKNIEKLGNSVTEKDVNILIDLAEAIAGITLAVKGAGAISGLAATLKTVFAGLGTGAAAAAAPIGTAAGVSVASAMLAAIIAAIAGWGLGSIIRDAIGEDAVDDFLFEVFDTISNWWDDFSYFWSGVGKSIADWYDSIIEELSDYFLKQQEGFEAAGKEIKDFFAGICDFFTKDIPNWWKEVKADVLFPIADKLVEAWNATETFVTDTFPKFFLETIPGFFASMWEDISDSAEEWSLSLGQHALDAWNSIKNTFSSVGTWFKNTFDTAWANIKSAFSLDTVKTHFSDVLSNVKGVFTSIGTWFKTTFSGAWDKVKEGFSIDDVKDHFDNIVSKIAEVFGGLADLLKEPFNSVIDLVNDVIADINDISIDIPHLDGSITTIGFNIPEIPKLATGTYIPANYGEFAAILGDNKREAEIVSPISAMKQALLEAMVEYNSVGNGESKQPLVIQNILERRVISEIVIDDINDKTRRNGKSPLLAPAGGV